MSTTMASAANAKAPREALAAPGPHVTGDQLSLELEAGTKEKIASKRRPPKNAAAGEVRKVRPELVSRYSFGCVA